MRLKALREKRGISQLKLAMDLGMNQNSYKQVRIRREGGRLQDADRAGGLF